MDNTRRNGSDIVISGLFYLKILIQTDLLLRKSLCFAKNRIMSLVYSGINNKVGDGF